MNGAKSFRLVSSRIVDLTRKSREIALPVLSGVSSTLSVLAINLLAANRLGIAGLGVFASDFALVQILVVVARLGTPRSAAVRAVANRAGRSEAGWATDVWAGLILVLLGCIASTALLGLLLATTDFYQRSVSTALLLAVLLVWLVGDAASLPLTESLRAFGRSTSASTYGVGGARFLGLLAVMLFARTYLGFVVALGASSLGLTALGYARVFLIGRVFAPPPISVVYSLWCESKVFLWAGVSNALFMNIPMLVAASAIGAADAGLFALASRLVFVVTFPLTIFGVLIPRWLIGAHHSGGIASIEIPLRSMAAAAFAAASCVAVCLFGMTVALNFGGESSTGIYFVAVGVLFISALANVGTGACAFVLSFSDHQGMVAVVSLASAAVAIVGCFVAGEVFGLLGFAIASGAVVVGRNVAMERAASSKIGVKTRCLFPSPSRVRAGVRFLAMDPGALPGESV